MTSGSDLLRIVDIARLLGVSHQRATQLADEPDFPEPIEPSRTAPIVAAIGVEAWGRGLAGAGSGIETQVPEPMWDRPAGLSHLACGLDAA